MQTLDITKVHQITISCKDGNENSEVTMKGASDNGVLQRRQTTTTTTTTKTSDMTKVLQIAVSSRRRQRKKTSDMTKIDITIKSASDNGVLQRGHAVETGVSRIIFTAVEK